MRVEQEGRSTTLQLPDQGPAQLSTHPPAGDLPSPELDEPLLDETWHLRWHANAQLLDDLRRAADDPTRFDSASKHLPADGQPEDDWQAACRVLELEEAIERSARRGRAIDLHHERVTERETFKSIMAAGGCLLLLWVLMLLVAASVIEGLRIGSPLFGKIWILLLAGPLVLFLGLQLLQFAFGSRDER